MVDTTLESIREEKETESWTEVITPRANLFDLRLGEVWKYRDLLWLFVRRDFIAQYKQTILGPIWHIIQPLFTTIIFSFFIWANCQHPHRRSKAGIILHERNFYLELFCHLPDQYFQYFFGQCKYFRESVFPQACVATIDNSFKYRAIWNSVWFVAGDDDMVSISWVSYPFNRLLDLHSNPYYLNGWHRTWPWNHYFLSHHKIQGSCNPVRFCSAIGNVRYPYCLSLIFFAK